MNWKNKENMMTKFELCTTILLAVIIVVSMYNTIRLDNSIKKLMYTIMFYKAKETKKENEDGDL